MHPFIRGDVVHVSVSKHGRDVSAHPFLCTSCMCGPSSRTTLADDRWLANDRWLAEWSCTTGSMNYTVMKVVLEIYWFLYRRWSPYNYISEACPDWCNQCIVSMSRRHHVSLMIIIKASVSIFKHYYIVFRSRCLVHSISTQIWMYCYRGSSYLTEWLSISVLCSPPPNVSSTPIAITIGANALTRAIWSLYEELHCWRKPDFWGEGRNTFSSSVSLRVTVSTRGKNGVTMAATYELDHFPHENIRFRFTHNFGPFQTKPSMVFYFDPLKKML